MIPEMPEADVYADPGLTVEPAHSAGLPPGQTGLRAKSGHAIGARQDAAAASGSKDESQSAAM